MNYRLTIFPALEVMQEGKEFEFKTEAEMVAASDTAADLLLFLQDDLKAMVDHSNMFVQEHLINGSWYELR